MEAFEFLMPVMGAIVSLSFRVWKVKSRVVSLYSLCSKGRAVLPTNWPSEVWCYISAATEASICYDFILCTQLNNRLLFTRTNMMRVWSAYSVQGKVARQSSWSVDVIEKIRCWVNLQFSRVCWTHNFKILITVAYCTSTALTPMPMNEPEIIVFSVKKSFF